MGKSKDDYIELCQVEMSRNFYLDNEDYFSENGCKLKAAYAINKRLKPTPELEELKKAHAIAKENLNEYEYLENYKKQLK